VKLEDVNFLLDKLGKYAYLWEQLGTALNFHPGELNNIRYSPQAPTLKQRLKDVLVEWTQWPNGDHPKEPSMEMLRDALCSDLVGLVNVGTLLYKCRYDLPSRQRKVKLRKCKCIDIN